MIEKIFVDASQSAVIKFGDGTPSMVTPTLQEAVIAFHKLAPEKQAVAVIHTASGQRFRASDVDRLHYKQVGQSKSGH